MLNAYTTSFATAVKCMRRETGPGWLMGAKAFAFRICVHEEIRPSAASVVD